MSRYEDLSVTKLRVSEIVNQSTSGATRGPNPWSGMWSNCFSTHYGDPSVIWTYMEDFIDFPLDANNEPTIGWTWSEDATADVTLVTGTTGGIISMTTDAADANHACGMQIGTGTAGTVIEYVKDSGKESWVEFRIAASQHTNTFNMFVGLASENANADNFINDAGDDFADIDVLGFVIWEADGADVDIVHQLGGTEFATIADAAENASDFHRYGMYFDGEETITFYVDGTANATTLDLDATSFPIDEELSPIIYLKNQTTSAIACQIDYIKMVCER